MKFTLLVVGRTVEKHYITAINDYVERTRHFISFDMEVIHNPMIIRIFAAN